MPITRIPLPRFQLSCDKCSRIADDQGDSRIHFTGIEFAMDWAVDNGWDVPPSVQTSGFTCPPCRYASDSDGDDPGCPEHGHDCDPDDHFEPPAVGGELI